MCTNFRPPSSRIVRDMQGLGGVPVPADAWPEETYPGYEAPIVTRAADGAGLVCSLARFGLVPRWSRDAQHAAELSRRTTNARSETVAEKPSFRAPWRERTRPRPRARPLSAMWPPSRRRGARAAAGPPPAKVAAGFTAGRPAPVRRAPWA
jgi:hypothetical protein